MGERDGKGRNSSRLKATFSEPLHADARLLRFSSTGRISREPEQKYFHNSRMPRCEASEPALDTDQPVAF